MTLREFIKKNAVNSTALNVPPELKSKCKGQGWEYSDVGSSRVIVAYNNSIDCYFVFKRMGNEYKIHCGKISDASDTLRSWSS